MLRIHRKVCFQSVRYLVNLPSLRLANQSSINDLVEVKQRKSFQNQLEMQIAHINDSAVKELKDSDLSAEDLKLSIRTGFATFLLHVEARIASSVGQGFYTIGPCGEEMLSLVALHMHSTDPSALHYRHVGTAIMRQLKQGNRKIEDIILDRARGFTCSTLDPVTGGRHCAIGGSPYDYLVTSTLASQCTPAVGRAQAIPLMHQLKLPTPFAKDAVSYVSLGDGSANNSHFLSAVNLAEYSSFNKIKCPIVFGLSDNGISISLKDNGWVHSLYSRLTMKKFIADANNIIDIHTKSRDAFQYARSFRRPVLLVFKNLNRRFGHAATDRQSAYLSQEEIKKAADNNPLLNVCALAVSAGITTWPELLQDYQYIQSTVEKAFDVAVNEPKITSRTELINSNSAPLSLPTAAAAAVEVVQLPDLSLSPLLKTKLATAPVENMRKLVTMMFDEALGGGTAAGNNVIYVGEDVKHGGYYLVTDGLATKYPFRVHDFPPDETALLGAAWGYSQAGMTPIVEIPYAKYLDCASDMFHEIALTHWLSNGREAPGLVIRLQGFDKGTFGGNFHTHNTLHMPLGLDVVCYSNGLDYVRGMRFLLRQASRSSGVGGGRVCMSVDSTDLLNRRHLYPELMDGLFLHSYPATATGGDGSTSSNSVNEMTFDDIVIYAPNKESKAKCSRISKNMTSTTTMESTRLVLVSYGNGLPTALIAMNALVEQKQVAADAVIVVDCPYLSKPPQQLEQLLSSLANNRNNNDRPPAVVFADVCKEGPAMPFAGFVVSFQKSGVLQKLQWRAVGAQPTYNPLGQTLTFLSTEDIQDAAIAVL